MVEPHSSNFRVITTNVLVSEYLGTLRYSSKYMYMDFTDNVHLRNEFHFSNIHQMNRWVTCKVCHINHCGHISMNDRKMKFISYIHIILHCALQNWNYEFIEKNHNHLPFYNISQSSLVEIQNSRQHCSPDSANKLDKPLALPEICLNNNH